MKTLRIGNLALAATMAGAALVAVVAGSAQAADMPVKARPLPVPIYTWTGFYGGFNAGYGWSDDKSITFTPGDPYIQLITCGGAGGGTCALPASSKLQGGFGGLQAGYNWQINPYFLAGLEADIQGSGIRGIGTDAPFLLAGFTPAQIAAEHKVTWFGTVRGRLGFLPTDRLLVYGTGGFAFGRVEASSVLAAGSGIISTGGGIGFNCTTGAGTLPNCFTGNSTRTATGWTAGAGFEYAVSRNISVKAEYLYVNLGTDNHSLVALSVANIAPPPTPASFIVSRKVDFSLARVGVNFRFDPPVVAKY